MAEIIRKKMLPEMTCLSRSQWFSGLMKALRWSYTVNCMAVKVAFIISVVGYTA